VQRENRKIPINPKLQKEIERKPKSLEKIMSAT
jgi:hypothetical protein